eukprot:6179900-Alexandrium_andersonii.AAC.3
MCIRDSRRCAGILLHTPGGFRLPDPPGDDPEYGDLPGRVRKRREAPAFAENACIWGIPRQVAVLMMARTASPQLSRLPGDVNTEAFPEAA